MDGISWDSQLPYSIDAFLSSRDGSVLSLHREFLRTYGVSSLDVPLLTLTPSLTRPLVEGGGWGRHGDPTGVDYQET